MNEFFRQHENAPNDMAITWSDCWSGTKVALAFRRQSERNPKPSVRSMLWRWVIVQFLRCYGFWAFRYQSSWLFICWLVAAVTT